MAITDQLKSKQLKRFETFHSQDTENGHFDVVFQLGDEKLYAHKFMLAGLSKPFAVMFSERWTTKDQPIKIDNYSYVDFKEFLKHFYFSECHLTDDNIFTMVDMAEYYDVPEMKEFCDEYLSKMNFTPENVFQMFELSEKYSSLPKFQSTLLSFMLQNLSSLLESGSFMKIKREILKTIVERLDSNQENLFEAAYKWAEHQVNIKQTSSENEPFDISQAFKEELAEILPKFHFERMTLKFMIKFVVPKGFLFSSLQELSEIIQKAKSEEIYVTVVNGNYKILTGKLSFDSSMLSNIYDTIKLAKDMMSLSKGTVAKKHQFWDAKIPRPSEPSQLKKNDNVKYYLIIDGFGYLAVKRTSLLDQNNYLLAELNGDDGFELNIYCYIRVNKF